MHVLVVDDNAGVREALTLLFALASLEVEACATPADALRIAARGETGCVVLDMNLRPGTTDGDDGIALYHALKRQDPDVPVVLITAYSDVSTAVALTRLGADDYLPKPWDDEALLARVRTLLARRTVTRDRTRTPVDLQGLVYASPAMHAVVELAARIAPTDLPVLVHGESGVGKDHVARIVHANSDRCDAPFVAVDCGALAPSLIEAELFGAERGAYTGAERARPGIFEQADGGTLFLDEVVHLSPTGQAALLRVLETGAIRRVGATRPVQVDVRVVSATNVRPEEAVARGDLREDLLYRLRGVALFVPPLRERPEDLSPLVDALLDSLGLSSDALDGTARAALASHPWPGNVRELKATLRRAAAVRATERIGVGDLGLAPVPEEPGEVGAIRRALRLENGNVRAASERLGLSRQALYRRMERLGIRVERKVR